MTSLRSPVHKGLRREGVGPLAGRRIPAKLLGLMLPQTDPTPIVELFRGNYATELLTAAVSHFDLFGRLAKRAMTLDELGADLGLARRPTIVLVTALRAMKFLELDRQQ